MTITYGGDTNGEGLYRPLQVPEFMNTPTERTLGQIPYLLMAGNAAAFCHLYGGEPDFFHYYRPAFQDYIRYLGVTGPDAYIDPALRTPTCYNSNIYDGTESKIHGWSSRYGMFLLSMEGPLVPKRPVNALMLLLLAD